MFFNYLVALGYEEKISSSLLVSVLCVWRHLVLEDKTLGFTGKCPLCVEAFGNGGQASRCYGQVFIQKHPHQS